MRPLPKKVSPGEGHCQKQLSLSDFKSSIWFHSNRCKYLHKCFHLRTRDDKKRTCTIREKLRGVAQSPCRRQSRDKRQGLWGREWRLYPLELIVPSRTARRGYERRSFDRNQKLRMNWRAQGNSSGQTATTSTTRRVFNFLRTCRPFSTRYWLLILLLWKTKHVVNQVWGRQNSKAKHQKLEKEMSKLHQNRSAQTQNDCCNVSCFSNSSNTVILLVLNIVGLFPNFLLKFPTATLTCAAAGRVTKHCGGLVCLRRRLQPPPQSPLSRRQLFSFIPDNRGWEKLATF